MQMLPTEKASIVAVTPKLAERWLSANYNGQRKVRRSTVAKYAREMAAGEWRGDNGQSITFSADGWLVDGQHRLRAVIESGCEVEMLVVRSSQDAAQIMATIDVGDKRMATQLYHGQDATTVCAMAKFELCLIYGVQGIYGCLQGRLSSSKGYNDIPTAREVVEHAEENEERLQRLAKLARRTYAANSTGASYKPIWAFIGLADFCKRDGEMEAFCEDFHATMPASETVAYARQYLMRAKLNRTKAITVPAALDVMLRAYESFCDGSVVKTYKPALLQAVGRWDSYVEERRAEL
jgi:hypothetical protein